MNLPVIVYFLIVYVVTVFVICAIIDHFNENADDNDYLFFGVMWPIAAIVFICILLPRIIFDYIKDILHDKFSKEMKEHKRAESRKLVEDVLIEISNQKNN
jgi:hypothetical protein